MAVEKGLQDRKITQKTFQKFPQKAKKHLSATPSKVKKQTKRIGEPGTEKTAKTHDINRPGFDRNQKALGRCVAAKIVAPKSGRIFLEFFENRSKIGPKSLRNPSKPGRRPDFDTFWQGVGPIFDRFSKNSKKCGPRMA